MKAEDLMIGDLVYYSYPNSFVTKVIDVCSHGEEHFIRCKRDAKDNLYKQDQLEDFNVGILRPIPLTPEILEKNDILYEKQSFYYVIKDDEDLECTYYIQQVLQGDWVVGVDIGAYDCSVFARVKYVHQLQHALKLCKIDKEIKL